MITLYKIIYWRPEIQEGGLYEVFYDEFWMPSALLNQFRRVLESLNNDGRIEHFPYKFCIEMPPGDPPVGKKWGHLFKIYPVVGGVPGEVHTWVVAETDTSISPAFCLSCLMERIAEDYTDPNQYVHYQY